MKNILLFALLILFCPHVFAYCTQTGNYLSGLVGLDGGNGMVYAYVTGERSCECSSIRFTPENTDTDKALGILLAAKVSNSPVRIDLKTAGNCNSGYRVYLQ